MKTILLTIVAALSFQLSAAGAEPVVVVVSATVVTVDGVNAGKPADTIRNRPELASAIQRALEARETQQAAALAAVQAKFDAALAANAALVAKLQAAATPAALAAVRAEAVTPELDRKRAALTAELAAKQKELDALR
jgi:hypothetical protein